MSGNPSIVMIVDDDNSTRKSVRRLMKSFGIAVETFASAEEFLGSDRLDKTSCLILDVHMPDINGFQLAEEVLSRNRKLPIIFQSGNATESDFRRAKALGALLLQKPVNAERLRSILKRLAGPNWPKVQSNSCARWVS